MSSSDPAWIVKSMGYLKAGGDVRPSNRAKVREILLACHAAGFRVPVTFGYNAGSTPEHSSGLADDFMVYNDRAAGEFIAKYIWKHKDRLGLRWQLWRQRAQSISDAYAGDAWRPMEDRGNGTVNHMDHVHVFFKNTPYIPPQDQAKPGTGTDQPKPVPAKPGPNDKNWSDMATREEIKQAAKEAFREVLWEPVIPRDPKMSQAEYERKVPAVLRSSLRNYFWQSWLVFSRR